MAVGKEMVYREIVTYIDAMSSFLNTNIKE